MCLFVSSSGCNKVPVIEKKDNSYTTLLWNQHQYSCPTEKKHTLMPYRHEIALESAFQNKSGICKALAILMYHVPSPPMINCHGNITERYN